MPQGDKIRLPAPAFCGTTVLQGFNIVQPLTNIKGALYQFKRNQNAVFSPVHRVSRHCGCQAEAKNAGHQPARLPHR